MDSAELILRPMASLWPGSHMMATAVLTANKINTANHTTSRVYGNQEWRSVLNCQRGERWRLQEHSVQLCFLGEQRTHLDFVIYVAAAA